MARTERRGELRSFWVFLIVVGLMTGAVLTSCGSGGGGSDGELCDQCGDDPDGPCRPSITIVPVVPDDPDDRIPQCTFGDPSTGSCTVQLQCRRKSDSGQRRCYPVAPGGSDVDYQFRCDGSRPGGTPRPEPTGEPTPEPDPTSTVEQVCGNEIREGTEVCDGTALNGETCGTRGCNPPTGVLSCALDCRAFNVSGCNGTGCRVTD